MSTAFLLFPGQGAQRPGMTTPFASSAEVTHCIARAEVLLDIPLGKWMTEGPAAQLEKTAYAQPALLVLGVAVAIELQRRGLNIVAAAGHSLGELTALAAAGAIGFDDAVRLAYTRGQAMQAAVPLGEGGMVALLGGDAEDVDALIAQAPQGCQLYAANYNAPGHIVVSGNRAGIDYAKNHAADFGIRRAIVLSVSAPFHSPWMAPAAEELRRALDNIEVGMPEFPVWSNATLGVHGSPNEIRSALVEQVTAPVRWTEQVQKMACSKMAIELPPGKTLTGLGKRIAPQWPVYPLKDLTDLDRIAKAGGVS